LPDGSLTGSPVTGWQITTVLSSKVKAPFVVVAVACFDLDFYEMNGWFSFLFGH
jgi:hypothetical protein